MEKLKSECYEIYKAKKDAPYFTRSRPGKLSKWVNQTAREILVPEELWKEAFKKWESYKQENESSKEKNEIFSEFQNQTTEGIVNFFLFSLMDNVDNICRKAMAKEHLPEDRLICFLIKTTSASK